MIKRKDHITHAPLSSLHLLLSQVQLLSKDFGKHLLEVDDLLQKHSLQEADIGVQAERVETLNTAALKFTTIEGKHLACVFIMCITTIVSFLSLALYNTLNLHAKNLNEFEIIQI